MARKKYTTRLPWQPAFLAAFAELKTFSGAATKADISISTVKKLRKREPAFEEECQRILKDGHVAKIVPTPAQWKRTFLDALAETSNVSASADRAGVSSREVYQTRRKDEKFARKWHAALVEGYEHLEMDLLSRLRSGEPKDGPKFDNGAALRLLALHRDTMAQEHAQRRNMDVISARALIERKLEDLRERVLARREAEGATIQ